VEVIVDAVVGDADGIAESVAATTVITVFVWFEAVGDVRLILHADIMIKVAIMRIKFIKFFIVPFSLVVR
jgi:hypothetical protein